MRCTILAWLVAASASADAIDGPPSSCPSGYTPHSDHTGPYCAPPLPTDCPPGYLPRVAREQPYCEPPPPTACPPGTVWGSSGIDSGECVRAARCETDAQCGTDATCREVSLCIEVGFSGNAQIETVHGPCAADGACAEGECEAARLCDPRVQRVDPQGRRLPYLERTPPRGCGCRAAPSHGGGWLALIALLVLARHRRRQVRARDAMSSRIGSIS